MKLEVYKDMAAARPLWLALERNACGALFQTFGWCNAWYATAGRSAGIRPFIVIGCSDDGTPQLLLPMMIAKTGVCRVLKWLAAPQISYGWGLYDRKFLASGDADISSLWHGIIALAGPLDAVYLADNPSQLFGTTHPLAGLFTLNAANDAYTLKLDEDYDRLYRQRRSSSSRRSARKRDNRLAGAGKVEFGLPAGPGETHSLLDQMFAQQAERLAEAGIIGAYGPAERAFFHRLADAPHDEGPLLAPYHLKVDGVLVATALGAVCFGTYWALISSLGSGPLRRLSPGDAALRQTIEACCQRQLEHFDFGSGETDYKTHWADDRTPLFDIIRGLTFKGYVWATLRLARTAIKRLIKQSPLLWSAAGTLRKLLFAPR